MVISIGYAACHWCHVMEHESFEDDEVAAVMNADFISVKVDREERPDIDQVYMQAAYVTTGRGGWPLNVIALPDQRPMFAGTYFSKRDWLHILNYFTEIYRTRPEELVLQATEVESGMKRGQAIPGLTDPGLVSETVLHGIYNTWREDLDFIHGGSAGAPKFPMPSNLEFMLHYGSRFDRKEALEYALLTLDRMSMGGIYDQLGGGFSRYSVDGSWRVPHFEKMLYDNAQLVSLYANAFAATGNYRYKQVVGETVEFIGREMTGDGGLFHASLDADSEGHEGTFYAWTREEIGKYLGESAGIFMEFFSCEDGGNWEKNANVLRKSLNNEDFAARHGLSEDQLSSVMDVCRNQLFTVRSNRIRPATDDKILTCWNAMMISALVNASGVFAKPEWLDQAIAAATFYRDHALERNGKLWRNSKGGTFAIAGFLDDYALLIRSFLDLYQATFDDAWLTAAGKLTGEAAEHFTAADGDFFNLSSDEEPRLIRESIELSDNVIPASNSVMAENLRIAGHLLGNAGYVDRSGRMLKKMMSSVIKNPSFHANWASLLANEINGPVEVSIIGEDFMAARREFARHYLPGVIFSGGAVKTPSETAPVRHAKGKTLVWVCRGRSCFSPVETVDEALGLIRGS
jgi:uncharacterized protein